VTPRPRAALAALLLATAALLALAASASAATHRAACHTGRHHACRGTKHRTTTSSCAGADALPTSSTLAAADASILCLVNQTRAHYGLRALQASGDLASAAVSHSDDMVANDYFDHDSPSGSTMLGRIFASGYAHSGENYTLGENIALGTGGLGTPRSIMAAWMASPGHRANILNSSFRDTGVGIAAGVPSDFGGGDAGATYTEDFGSVNGH
jgi:uncharacterized protein YkwD